MRNPQNHRHANVHMECAKCSKPVSATEVFCLTCESELVKETVEQVWKENIPEALKAKGCAFSNLEEAK